MLCSKKGGKIEAAEFLYTSEAYNNLSAAFIGGTEPGISELIRYGLCECEKMGYDSFGMKTASKKTISAARREGLETFERGGVLLYMKR